MAENKKKKGRKAYLNDIQPNLAGEYVYVGAHYRYASEGMSYSRARAAIMLLEGLSLLSLIAAGCVSAGGMGNCVYVIVPYIAEAIAVFVTAYAVFKLVMGGEKLREYVYEASVKRIPGGALCSSVFAVVSAVCILVFTILNGIDGSAGEFVLLTAAKAVGIAAPLFLRKFIKTLKWEKEA